MALQPLSTEHGARLLLQRLVDAGRVTVEQLDSPPPGHCNPQAYRNLLRDPEAPSNEKVEVVSPRDFQPEPSEAALPF
jgi:hypothetical protein